MSDLRQTWADFIARRVSPHFADALGGHRRFLKDASGSVLVYVGLTSFVLLGSVGLAVDVGHWYGSKRTMQSAADAAAMGGAFALGKGDSTIIRMAKSDASLNGYDATMGAVVTINHPPSSGPYAGDMGAVEAIIQQPVPGFFSTLFLDGPTNIAARAVARTTAPEACVFVLDPSMDGALKIAGSSIVNLDCGIQVNSDSPKAFQKTGASCVTATRIAIVGDSNANVAGCTFPGTESAAPYVPDPLAGRVGPPSYSGCDHTDEVHVTTDTTLYPGVYCGGIQINSSPIVNFEPGLYVVGGTGLQITGSAKVTGEKVTFYLEPLAGTVRGNTKVSLDVAGTTTVDLSAPELGAYAGILFYQDRNTASKVISKLVGGTDMSLTGALYFPNTELKFAGGSEVTIDEMMIIARQMEFVGNSDVNGEPGGPLFSSTLGRPTLVE